MKKKRYQVSLTQSVADQLKVDIESLGLPAATFSRIIDDALVVASPSIHRMAERARKGGAVSFTEVLNDAAKIIENFSNDESNQDS